MNRIVAVFLGGVLGAALGVTCYTLFITLTYPHYYRDAGSPPLLPGIIFGCPAGLAIGLVIGAIWPLKNRY